MDNLAKYIEHTLLKQDATQEDLVKLFDEAKQNNFKGNFFTQADCKAVWDMWCLIVYRLYIVSTFAVAIG